MRYEVIEWNYLTNEMAQRLHHQGGLDLLSTRLPIGIPAAWTLKGTEYLWLRDHLERLSVSRVLDVGPQSSPIPQVLAEDFGVEAWAIDKFGDDRIYARDRLGELAKKQGGDPRELYRKVTYVNAFMGDRSEKLKSEHFDLVYSLSTLEHIDYHFMPDVFADMDRVLKTGGYMAHAVDLSLPLGVSATFAQKLNSGSERVEQIRRLPFSGIVISLLMASSSVRLPALPMIIGQWFYHLIMSLQSGLARPYLMTAPGWSTFLRRRFSLDQKRRMRSTGLLHSLLSQDLYKEPVGARYELWPPEKQIKPYWPMTTLMFVLRKQS